MKLTPAGRALVGAAYEEGTAYPGAKPSTALGAELIDDPDRLCELIRATADALPQPRPRVPAKARRPPAKKAAPTRPATSKSPRKPTKRKKAAPGAH